MQPSLPEAPAWTSAPPSKSGANASSSRFARLFPSRAECRKVSHRHHIPKSGGPQVPQIFPKASISPLHTTLPEQLRIAMKRELRPLCAVRLLLPLVQALQPLIERISSENL